MPSTGQSTFGRYVIVQMDNGRDALNLQEVQVFGSLPTTITTTTTTATTTFSTEPSAALTHGITGTIAG